MADTITAGGGIAPAGLKGLFQELGDLKRIRSAGHDGSWATRAFAQAWAALVAGAPVEQVADATTAAALAAARLGDLDRATLERIGLTSEEAQATLERAFDAVAADVPTPLRERLRGALRSPKPMPEAPLPPFVAALARQPRAGVTCPDKPRIVLEPPENHAEHCLLVAVYGVLLSPAYGADAPQVFLAGLAHHLHNAAMPDSGFTGEVLLGDRLDHAVRTATALALREIEEPLRGQVEGARAILPDAGTPEGRAFHAADVVDRVLQIAQHLRAASLTMHHVLAEMELVHAGPVKAFHDRVLDEMHIP